MKTILIIDDSSFMRTVLKDLLTNKTDEDVIIQPIEIFEADSKEKALKMVKKIKPHAILLDVVMRESELEGLEFLREIKDYFNPHNVIMISSIGQPSVLEECKKIGISIYLQKPFEKKQVIEALNNVLA